MQESTINSLRSRTREIAGSFERGFRVLSLADLFQFLMLMGLAVLQLLLWKRLPQSHLLFVVYVSLIVATTIACLTRPHVRTWVAFVDEFLLPTVILLVIFETIGYSIPMVNSAWFEAIALNFDLKLFGMVGSVYLERFYSRVLLDWFHLFYVSFYFFPVSLMLIMFARKSQAEFQHALAVMLLAFYLCFVLYFLFPVVGPYRNAEVGKQFAKDIIASGGHLTRYVRKFVQHAEWTSYDCFPSAHTAVTLVTIFLAYRYKLRIRRYYLLPAVMVLISTVYLRYHYVLDIIAGAVTAVAAYWIPGALRKVTGLRK